MKEPDFVRELESEGVQLWEDGGNLRFRGPKGVMTEGRRTALGDRKQEVLECLRARHRRTEITPQPALSNHPFPLTDMQAAYLIGRREVFAYGGVGCHGYGEIAFRELDVARLEAAWRSLIRRHDMLRAVIQSEGTQRVLDSTPPFDIRVLDIRGRGPAEVASAISQVRAEMDHRVYQPDQWPLFDLRVVLKPEEAVLHLSIDLLIADFVSTQLLLEELHDFYFEPERALQPLDLTFRDYVLAEKNLRCSERYQVDREYWLGLVDSLPPPPDLPFLEDDPRQGARFERRQTKLSSAQWASLCASARDREVTPSVVVLAVYAEVIALWCRRPEFTLNVTLQNRLPLHPQAGQIVGDFTSIELLAARPDPNQGLLQRTRALQGQLWDDLDHRLFSGIDVLREISRRQGAQSPIFPVVYTSSIGVPMRDGGPPQGLGELKYGITQTPQVWIDCQALETRSGLTVNWDTREGVFPAGLLDDMFAVFEGLLRRVAASEEVWTEKEPAILPPVQLARRRAANNTSAPLPETLLHEGIVAQALRAPDRPAVITPLRTLSYRDLLHGAMAVARTLREHGVAAGELVGIMLAKGCDQPVAVLGTLLAGAVYVPLDTGQPLARLKQLILDAGIRVVLSHSSRSQECAGAACIVEFDSVLPETSIASPYTRLARPEDPAYVIYTSGSTGVPKGVVVSHLSAVNTVVDVNRRFAVHPDDRILGLANLGFDLSVYDIFGPLSVGGCLVIPSQERRADPSHWAQLITDHRVTLWNSVPAQMQMLCDYLKQDRNGRRISSLRLALLSGDWIPVKLPGQVKTMLPGLQLISLGGATEAAIWSIFHPITKVRPEWHSIPYGRPLANQTFQVLNSSLRSCPDWVPGELYIGGAGLALGYHRDEQKTAEKFIRHPVGGERLYRTGDFGRYLPDGQIEFLGRADRQVKVRGHRIELGEVEAALSSHPAVAKAIVLADDGGQLEPRLVAFVELAPLSDAPQPLGDFSRLREATLTAGSQETQTAERPEYAEYAAHLNEAALRSIEAAIQRRKGPGAVTDRLIRRWTRALERNALGKTRSEGCASDPALVEESWNRVEARARGLESEPLVSLLRAFSNRLPELLNSAENTAPVLAPDEWFEFVRTIQCEALFSKWARKVAGSALRHIGANSVGKIRVMEQGAFAPLAIEAAGLIGMDVHCLITDPSHAVLDEARRSLAPSAPFRFAIFDPDRDLREQGFQPNTFDLVIANNVLHRATNVDHALGQVRTLLASGGWLIVIEMTCDHYAMTAPLEVLNDSSRRNGDFTDVRQRTGSLFLTPGEWQQALASTGGECILCLPDDEHALARFGMRVFVARFKQDRPLVRQEELLEFLKSRLPGHLLPAHLQIVDAMPLTNNGKTDTKHLKSWIPKRRANLASPGSNAVLETRLLAFWSEVLDLQDIDPHRSFLELGGDSLLAARLAGRLREALPEAADAYFDELLRKLITGTTVAELALWLTTKRNEDPVEPQQNAFAMRKLGGTGQPVRVLVHDGTGNLARYAPWTGTLAEHGAVLGLVVADPDAFTALSADSLLERAAEAYVQTLVGEGHLTVEVYGSGAGSPLAVEVARQLAETGAIVERLVLIGAAPPRFYQEGSDTQCLENCIYRHYLKATSARDEPPYAGDIVLVQHPEDPSREEAVAYWRRACLGTVFTHEAPDHLNGLVEVLLEPASQ